MFYDPLKIQGRFEVISYKQINWILKILWIHDRIIIAVSGGFILEENIVPRVAYIEPVFIVVS